jgi:hypothetical protein
MNTLKPHTNNLGLGNPLISKSAQASIDKLKAIVATPQPAMQVQNTVVQNAGPKTVPTKGIFDWIGAQENGIATGFHISANDLQAGDIVKITEASGKYSGVHEIKYMGGDDGTAKDSIMTLALPKVAGQGQASGTWELVNRKANVNYTDQPAQPGINTADNSNSDDGKGISAGIIFGTVAALGIIGILVAKNI